MMLDNEEVVRNLYAAAEGEQKDIAKFLSCFSDEGYMYDMAAGLKLQGQALGDAIDTFVSAFPDLHRELLDVYVAGDVVVVELAVRGTHRGELQLPSGRLAPTGKRIDVPSCDVFHVQNGKVTSFHCYNMPSAMLQQLGAL
jgi:ketosteroid isomerase-like protein